eukprot:250229_1
MHYYHGIDHITVEPSHNIYLEPQSPDSPLNTFETDSTSSDLSPNHSTEILELTDVNSDSKQDEDAIYVQSKEDSRRHHTQSTLQSHGYVYRRKIAKTLQGEVFEAVHSQNMNQVVIVKKAIKSLVNQRITIRDNKQIKIDENIWREIDIMKYLDIQN